MELTRDASGQLYYATALLRITVLGGIKLEGLDRLRVTLEFSVPDSPRPAIRHNLDLYNDNAVGKLVRSVAARMEVGMSVTEAHIEEVIRGLQAWRLEEIKILQGEVVSIKPLTEDETARGMAFLKAAQLTPRLGRCLRQSGIIGEEVNAIVLHRCMTSSKMNDPLGAICIAQSGTGKSHLMEKVAACFPEESKMECTQLTPASLYYMERYELSHRIILIEDLEGAREVMYPLRELQSRKKIAKHLPAKGSTGKVKTELRIVEGPIALIACTTQEAVFEDNANRSIILYLDGSKEQDARIMAHQGTQRAGTGGNAQEKDAQALLRIAYRLLKPIKVINPYAELITLPKEVGKPRRTLSLLLNFIEVGTFIHQYQREQKVDAATGELYIETSIEDIEEGFALLKETLFRKADELSGACRETLEWIKANTAGSFTQQSIRKVLRKSPHTLRRHLDQLTAYGYLERDKGKKHSTGYAYTLGALASEDLSAVIDAHVREVLASLRQAQEGTEGRSSAVVQNGDAPPTELNTKKKEQVEQVERKKIKRNEKRADDQSERPQASA